MHNSDQSTKNNAACDSCQANSLAKNVNEAHVERLVLFLFVENPPQIVESEQAGKTEKRDGGPGGALQYFSLLFFCHNFTVVKHTIAA
jgi:hypothetical protein